MDTIRTQLQHRLAELEVRAGRIDAHRRSLLPADSEEAAQHMQSGEVMDALDDAARLEMVGIRAALERIADGSYGLCEICGEKIPRKRLAILPLATRCVEHADD